MMMAGLQGIACLSLVMMLGSAAALEAPLRGHGVVRVTPIAEHHLLYDLDHIAVRVTPTAEHHLNKINDLLKMSEDVDVWKYPSAVNKSVDLRLSPLNRDYVMSGLAKIGLPVKTIIKDVQDVLDKQKADRQAYMAERREFNYSHYHTLEEINEWMHKISREYRDIVTLFNVTKSYEGRTMYGLKIRTSRGAKDRPAFFLEGGIHAREWISPATIIYMTWTLLRYYSSNPGTLDLFDWYIVPVVNPDGYAYTWKSDETRLWRKTRSINGGSIGVDPNRNWDAEWCTTGASRDPCSQIYCGPKPFSEPETKGVADFILKIGNVKAFIDFHSYTQLWMSPYAYSTTLPSNFSMQNEGSRIAVQALKAAIKIDATEYNYGSVANTIYKASGNSIDWAYMKAGVKYTYAVELRDKGEYGFLLPEDQIEPSGLETIQALLALAEYISGN